MSYIRCILGSVKGHERQIVEKGFEQDRLNYWAMRDELLAKYSGKWVAVHKGCVVAVADEPLSIEIDLTRGEHEVHVLEDD
jgi:Family of unknown function (DUF5678)